MTEIKHISLSELQALIKKGIADNHPLPYWVVAEISEIKTNASGHCYLELVEKGGNNAIPRAKASAVIWRNHYTLIDSYFRSATGGELCAGIKVLVKAAVNYHELYGISFQITDIEPAYTLGDIEAQRRETIERLQKEGIYAMNRELDLPEVLQRLAVISSEQAAGYRDFRNELSANPQGYGYRLTLFPATMQGQQTEESVIAALDAIAGRMDEFDAVIVIRGGGAQSDLAAFNSYRLTSHLAQFPLPILTGIGHDKDQSVADQVAHTPLKTPTAVATFLTEHNAAFEAELLALGKAVAEWATANLRNEHDRLTACAHRLNVLTSGSIHGETRRLDDGLARLRYGAAIRLQQQNALCDRWTAEIARTPLQLLHASASALSTQEHRLVELVRFGLNNQINRLALLESKFEGKNPERILRMGYAIVRDTTGRVVKHIDGVQPGDTLSVQLQGGTAEAQVTRKIIRSK
jgi:exodeoxyribonuclease VII large subunit